MGVLYLSPILAGLLYLAVAREERAGNGPKPGRDPNAGRPEVI